MFKKQKTGPLAFNVEYTLSQLKLKKRALTPEEVALATAAMTIDDKMKRPTAAEVKALLERLKKGADVDSTEDDGVDREAVADL